MKRQIILRIIVCIAAVAMLFTGLFIMAACGNKTGDDGATYQLNLSEDFDGIVTYGEPMDFTGITLLRTQDGETTVIQVDSSMVTTHVDTTKIGAKLLKFNYAGQSFHVPVIVKYKIQFEVDGEPLKTFHVLNAGELEEVKTPEKLGYVFAGWSEEIPEIITENMTFSAVYTPEIPAISEVDATYGDKLSSIQLPYTVVGAWQFDDAEGTVGDAGKRTFPVSFISYESGEVLATDTVTVSVAKKEITFSEIVDSFIYNGERQIPTYKTDAPVNVLFYEDSESNYTDAGVYGYYFEVDDPNYKGTLVGTYEIKPAVVNVKINSYTILANEELPVVEYEVWGFDNIELIGLSITNPEDVVMGVGTYTLTATASNKNFVLEVEEGTITVNSTTLQIADPTLSTGVVTYGDLISVIEFGIHPNGKWTWKTPDDLVGDAGKQTHIAVFTPTDSRYDVIERAVEITVAPKELVIEIVGSTSFDYSSTAEHTLSCVVKDEATGTIYDLAVLGNTPCKNAGVYEITLTLEDKNYSATKVVTLTVNKIDPVTNFEQVLSATWSKTLKLSNVTLPAGYAWVDSPATEITTAGTHRFKAIYTPEDTTNYNTVSGEFEINVAKASASINNVNANYDFIYNGGAFTLDTVTRSHTESELVFAYQKDGKAVDSLTNAGVYTVTITLPETGNYEAAVVTTTVTIAKANNVENVILSQTATYGDLVFEKITLPAGIEGTWSVQNTNETTTVGDAGTKTFVAVYTSTTGNYNSREVEITVTVAQKRINAPTISANYREQVFTGATLTSGLTNAEGYVVTDNGAVNVGTHTVTVALVSNNYMWSDGTSADKTLTYRIVAADNQWTTEPSIDSWVYGDAGNAGNAEALAGTVTIEYKVLGADDSTYSTTVPTNAGAYVARFTATDSNYKDLVATCEFSIAKKAVAVPEISASKLAQVYNGSVLTSGLTDTEEYTVTDNGGANVATYTATLILKDKNNYKWATTDASENVQLTYEVVKAQIVISDLAINGWTFGAKANVPTANTNFTCNLSYVYATAIDGEYTTTVPTNAGTYYVKAIAQGNENLIGAESEAISFTIAKASVTINGANDTYTKVYDTKEYTVTGVTASNGEALTVVITKNGATVEKIIDAGTYTVTFSIEESANYLAAEKSVTVTVTAATNSETVIVNQNAVYGDLTSVIKLPAGVQGSWSLKDVVATDTVGNAGVNTFTAMFTPANGNYSERTVVITVTVAKATVKVPIVDPKEYDEQYHNSGLTETDHYVITEDNGGVNHGTYNVVLTLKDSANYKWETFEAASITIKYEISAAINKWAEEPTIGSWEYESAGNPGHAVALHGGVKIEYKLESADDSAYSTTLPTLPGKYIARFTTTDDNYTVLSATRAFEITKRKITPPTQSETEFVYTGNTITSGIIGNEFYTVVDNGAINVQDGLVVTVTLKSKHYVWSDGVEALAREYTYSITKANVTVSDLAIKGWTFGMDANAPTANTNFATTITYVYADAIGGEYTATVPTDAGTYYVKAIAAGNENLIGAESTPISFTIAKASVTIEGAKDTYTKVYDTEEFIITGVTASNGAELTVTVTNVNGGKAGVAMINVGTYTVTFSVAESDNYLKAEKSVTVTITPATNTEIVNTNQSATYGDLISVIVLPAGVEGTWSIEGDATTVGNAGVNKFTAVFTPDSTGNYNKRTVEITVTVARKSVPAPTVPATKAEQTYTGALLTSGLVNGTGYTVTDNGGTNVGTYEVILTLDATNYVWSDGTDAAKTLTYTIVAAENDWSVVPEISGSWIYGQEGDAGRATAAFGGVKIEYKLATAGDDAYSTTLPTNAGEYVARFTTTDTNHTKLVETRTFTITKATVSVPTVDDKTYTGSTITSGLVDTDKYTVTIDEGGINVGTYNVTLTLKDSDNYTWGNDSVTTTVSYQITKAKAEISGLAIEGWTFGADANVPTATTNFGTVTYLYAPVGGEYTATVPTDAGNYYVKAVVAGTDNFDGAESAAVSFTIAKAAASINGAQATYTTTYSGNAYTITGVTASNGLDLVYTIYNEKGEVAAQMLNAGTYKVVITLAESGNHLGATVEVTVKIEKIKNTDTIPTYEATYGDALSTLTPPTSATGTWSWQTVDAKVGNAGVQKHVLVFAPFDTTNYEGTTAEAIVNVSKKAIAAPAVPNASVTYNGETQYSGLVNNDIYTVSDNGGVNKGTYTATLTIIDSNYVWNNASDTITVTYTINPAENKISVKEVENFQYGQELKFEVSVAFGGWIVEYKPADAEDSAYSTVAPTAVGKYIARFTTTDSNCSIETEPRAFDIIIATVDIPAVSDKNYTGEKITSGLTNNALYTVVEAGGVDAGTYYVTVSLVDKNNYMWSDGTTNDQILTYKIIGANVIIEGIKAGWTYGEFVAPTATVKPAALADQVIYWYSTDDGATWSQTPPTNAGDEYRIKAEIVATGNYGGFVTDGEDLFNILPAQSFITTIPSFVAGTFYQNQFNPSTRGLTAADKNGNNLEGTFTYGEAVFADGFNKSSIELTFTPDDSNYMSVTVTYNMTFVAVAYLNNTTPYGSIEEAMRFASSGDTIWVRPTDKPIYITEDLVVKSDVTLLLPYGITNDIGGRNQWEKADQPEFEGHSKTFYPPTEDDCVVKVILAAGKTLTNNGVIEISGQLSGSNGGHGYAGSTYGKHARLVLGENATLINNGVIYAAGYIREETKENGSIVILEQGSVLYQPFTLLYHSGGSALYAMKETFNKNPITPFNDFFFMNVSPFLRINYGAALRTWASLYAGSQHNTTIGNFIGSVTDKTDMGKDFYTDSVIVLTNSQYSYLTADYDEDTRICDLHIYGGAKTNSMELTIKVNILLSATINTEQTPFAISHYFNITLSQHPEQSDIAEFNMNQKFKILPGSTFIVEEGVKLTVKDLIVYEKYEDKRALPQEYLYPSVLPSGELIPPGKLIVNGELVVTNFGGTIYTENPNAKVTIKTATSYSAYELISVDGLSVSEYQTITQHAIIFGPATVTTPTAGTGTKVVLDYADGTQVSVLVFGDKYPVLPVLEKDGYRFEGWFYGDQRVNANQGETDSADVNKFNVDTLKTTGEHTLTAKWTKLFGITFDANIEGVENSVIYLDDTHTVYPELPVPTKDGYVFLGWFYDGVQVNAGDAFKSTDDHTLTAQWKRQIAIGLDTNEDGAADSYAYVDSDQELKYTLTDPVRTGYKFLGWYYGETPVQSGDALVSTENHMLTAMWRKLVAVTLDTLQDEIANQIIYIDATLTNVYPTLPTLTKDGYEFKGWYCNGTEVTTGTTLVTTEDHTLTAKWQVRVLIMLDPGEGGSVSEGSVYAASNGEQLVYPTLPTPTKGGYTFVGWQYNGQTVAANDALQITDMHTLTAKWQINASYKITVTTSKATVYVNGTKVANKGTVSIPYGTQVTVTVEYEGTKDQTTTIKKADGTTISGTSFTMPEQNVTINATSSSGSICVTPDTLVTLADGTQKRIENVEPTDMLLVWNFYEGKYDVAPASILMNHGYDTVEVLTLVFADGTTIGTINGHGFFDVERNEFVILKTDNVADFVGHNFVKLDGDSYSTTELVGYTVETRYTEVWSILTVVHYNAILEGLWSVTEAEVPNSPTYLMPFVVGEDMKYDSELMQADIEKYGLYTYEEFAMYCTKEQFEALGLKYFKVAVGKGAITREQIIYLLELHCS